MTPLDIREIWQEGDRETMREALRQIEEGLVGKDPLRDRIIETARFTKAQATVLAYLWKRRGKLVRWEPLMDLTDKYDYRDVQYGAVKRLREKQRRQGWNFLIDNAYAEGVVLRQTGPVPWERPME